MSLIRASSGSVAARDGESVANPSPAAMIAAETVRIQGVLAVTWSDSSCRVGLAKQQGHKAKIRVIPVIETLDWHYNIKSLISGQIARYAKRLQLDEIRRSRGRQPVRSRSGSPAPRAARDGNRPASPRLVRAGRRKPLRRCHR